MPEHVFFYGTLMTPFNRPGRQRVDANLRFTSRGTINAALFDLGIYPAAVPTNDGSRVTIEHDFSRPLPIVRAELVPRLIDRLFVRPIAGRTLARFKLLAESGSG